MMPFKIELDTDISFRELNEMHDWIVRQSDHGLFQCTMHWFSSVGRSGRPRSYIVPLPCARASLLLTPARLIDYPVQAMIFEFAMARTALHFKMRWA